MTTIDIDVGGTFTDGFFTVSGNAYRAKVFTTPHALSDGIMACLEAGAAAAGTSLGQLLSAAAVARLSTTVGTNTVIQKTGPKLALFISRGSAAAQGVADNFVASEMIWELDEEIDAAGEVRRPLDPGAAAAALRAAVAQGARLLVVALRHSWANPAHERLVKAVARERYPEHYLRRVLVQAASDLTWSRRETARCNTAVLNAYVHREMARTLYRTEDQMRTAGLRRPLLIVHNSGGVARVAKTTAVHTHSSGPVSGLIGAATLARAQDYPLVITLDVGGTSTDVAIIRGGRVDLNPSPQIAHLELAVPMMQTVSVGAGGGSIARVEQGRVEVGPQSAGSLPGPACFGRGGTLPTATDADLILGLLDHQRFLAGRQRLDPERAAAALAEHVAGPLGCSLWQGAARVRRRMVDRLGEVLAGHCRQAGSAPEAVVAFFYGGAGPVYACDSARQAGVRRVVVFPFGSVFNAFGANTMDVAHHYFRPLHLPGGHPHLVAAIRRHLAELRAQATSDMVDEGFAPEAVRCAPCLFTTPDAGGPVSITPGETGLDGGGWVEAVGLQSACAVPHWRPAPDATAGVAPAPVPDAVRTVYWDGALEPVPTPVFHHTTLRTGSRLAGPALVDVGDSVCVVPTLWQLQVDPWGNYELTDGGGA